MKSTALSPDDPWSDVPVHRLHLLDPAVLGRGSASSSSGAAGARLADDSELTQPPAELVHDETISAEASQVEPLLIGGARGTPLEVRQRQDKAAGGIGKRRLVRVTTDRKGKKRQHGGQIADEVSAPPDVEGDADSLPEGGAMEDGGLPLQIPEGDEGAGDPSAPAYKDGGISKRC